VQGRAETDFKSERQKEKSRVKFSMQYPYLKTREAKQQKLAKIGESLK